MYYKTWAILNDYIATESGGNERSGIEMWVC